MIDLKKIKTPQVKTRIPGPKAKELLELKEKYVPLGVYLTVPTFIKRGEGAVIEDLDGNILIDFAGGIGVLHIGYSHPEVVEAVKTQAEKYFHTSINVVLYESYIKLAQKLAEITPGDYHKKTMFVNSGAEAVENAIKIARKYTGKTDIISFEGAFHGRTLMTMSLTSKVKPYKFGFGPFAPGVYKLPFAYCYRCSYGLERETCNLRCAERLEEIFVTVTSAEDVAAVILEPIQGEGGFIVPPKEFVTRIKEICEANDVLLICDEIQSGFSRTGKMFACEHWDVMPDIITMAKSLAGGMPLSAVTARNEIMDAVHVGGIGGTYCGNPLACEAALKVIEIMEKEDFPLKAQKIGKICMERLKEMEAKYEIIGDIRGIGAMIGVELVKDRATKEPAVEETNQIINEAYENGLVLLKAGMYDNVIRFLMPLVITDDQLNAGLDIVEKAIKNANARL